VLLQHVTYVHVLPTTDSNCHNASQCTCRDSSVDSMHANVQVRHMLATNIKGIKPTDRAFPMYVELLEAQAAQNNQSAISELMAMKTGSSQYQWDLFYDR
jgi:hypothetical protein